MDNTIHKLLSKHHAEVWLVLLLNLFNFYLIKVYLINSQLLLCCDTIPTL